MSLDWVHLTTELPEAGRRVERVATPGECAAVAKDLGLAGCSRLVVTYHVRPLPGGRYRVEGRIGADIEQPCVVTLEPVAQTIDEPIDVTFSPDGDRREDTSSEREILSEPDIEPLADGRIEVGRVAFELLAAAIDPYPRRPGAELDPNHPAVRVEGQGLGTGEASPFAVLAKLKDKL